ncbi:MAG: C4-dicarboxylate ABC transporter permease [Methylobacterium sp. SCN 67-24]|nr:MAG: C4-dicarboxylate ABC transporter permease [Methylobacterium sp. SCN 67-24]
MTLGLALLLASFTVLVALDAPIAVALGLASVVYLLVSDLAPLIVVAQRVIAGIDSFTLLAIPLFLLAGLLLLHGDLTPRIIRLCSALVGRARGGLAIVMVMGCMLFGALSGSGVADVVAIGTMMLPAMKERGYDTGFSCSLLGCAGSLGTVIPPSIVLIVYGTATNTSIGALFVAAIIPGILTGLGLMIVAYIIARRNDWRGGEAFNWGELWLALKDSALALLGPVIIIGGIRGGIFTATEAAGIGVLYALIVGGLIYRKLTVSESSASILFVIACASIFGWILAAEQVPQLIVNAISSATSSATVALLMMMAVLLILGTFMETIAIILILAPVFIPILRAYQIDPVFFGVLLTVNLAIGANTPPLGIDLMAACRVGGIPMSASFRYLLPFIGSMVAVLLLMVLFPGIVLGPARLFGH